MDAFGHSVRIHCIISNLLTNIYTLICLNNGDMAIDSWSIFRQHQPCISTVFKWSVIQLLCIFSERQLRYVRYMLSTVCLSVCRLAVYNVGAPYSAGWNFRQFFSPYDSSGTLVFWCQNSLVGDASFPVKFAFKVTHPPFKQRNFYQYRLIVPQPW